MAGPNAAPNGYSTLATPRARRRLRAKSPFLASGQTNGAPPPVVESGVECPAEVREKYWVGRKIGDGNFAVVCECVHRWVWVGVGGGSLEGMWEFGRWWYLELV